MEGTRVLNGQGHEVGQGHVGDMCMEGTWVWKGHGYGRDKGMEGTMVWK